MNSNRTSSWGCISGFTLCSSHYRFSALLRVAGMYPMLDKIQIRLIENRLLLITIINNTALNLHSDLLTATLRYVAHINVID